MPGIADLEPRLAEPVGDRAHGRVRARRRSRRARPGRSSSRARSSHGPSRRWSWLPGTSTTSRPANASPIAAKNSPRLAERVAERAVAELDRVAEQDEPLGAGLGDRLEQALADRRAAQDVARARWRRGGDRRSGRSSASAAILATPIGRQPPPDHRCRGRPSPDRLARGKWRARRQRARDAQATTNGAGIAVENPATGETLATVPDLGARRGRGASSPPPARRSPPGGRPASTERGAGADGGARLDGRQRRPRRRDDLRRDRQDRRRDAVRRARLRRSRRSSSGRRAPPGCSPTRSSRPPRPRSAAAASSRSATSRSASSA